VALSKLAPERIVRTSANTPHSEAARLMHISESAASSFKYYGGAPCDAIAIRDLVRMLGVGAETSMTVDSFGNATIAIVSTPAGALEASVRMKPHGIRFAFLPLSARENS
jgi:hypothetical protein